jgi:hypothetical protein
MRNKRATGKYLPIKKGSTERRGERTVKGEAVMREQ